MNLHTISVYHLSLVSFYREMDGFVLPNSAQTDDFERFKRVNALFLEAVLSKHSGEVVAQKDILVEEFGKPFLDPNPFMNLHFSVSHTKNDVAIAVAAFPLGLDLEFIQDQYPKSIEKRLVHPDDQLTVENARQFYRLWSIKEAFVKYTGQGLRLPLNEIVVTNTDLACLKLQSAQQHAEVREVHLLEKHTCFLAGNKICSAVVHIIDHAASAEILRKQLSKKD
jgi:phosphopantetheinyl transferase